MSLFSFLFPNKPEETSSWSQTQREALVDLLYLSIYIDNHLSLVEEKKVEDELKKADWDGLHSSSLYAQAAINRARDAKSNVRIKSEYLANIAERLDEKKITALEALDAVLSSDGTDKKEAAFLKEVRSAFKL
ncbi:hypothetical protein IEN85_12825 [Pelagicoccus sp. NFK12]|uniref:Co-chaperone DjlA N-terminal domain-containing protein n=1 Tax=Pelagicoccus enzymogenes TaxID=2773457 RepID=A0A927F8E1_9BACT|nr:hypothetical protein [Pelagicoccus enzymogenes]MBD5780377.1 hypothetical protein [Pelagicoccus enzymogenes]MDQ8197720.1 hypothetical protein [Pelagicoccus enzymogenes]